MIILMAELPTITAGRRAFSSRLFVTDGDAAVQVVNDYPGAIPL
jgi:hypothetical protein